MPDNLLVWSVIIVVGTISDSLLGMLALRDVIEPKDALGFTVCIAGGLIVTCITMLTKDTISGKVILPIRLMWLMAISVDVMTSFVVVYKVTDLSDIVSIVIATFISLILTGCAISVPYLLGNLQT